MAPDALTDRYGHVQPHPEKEGRENSSRETMGREIVSLLSFWLLSYQHTQWHPSSRPKTTNDVAHQAEVIAMLQNCVKGGDVLTIAPLYPVCCNSALFRCPIFSSTARRGLVKRQPSWQYRENFSGTHRELEFTFMKGGRNPCCLRPVLIKDRILELNASDERGINVVRQKVVLTAAILEGMQRIESVL